MVGRPEQIRACTQSSDGWGVTNCWSKTEVPSRNKSAVARRNKDVHERATCGVVSQYLFGWVVARSIGAEDVEVAVWPKDHMAHGLQSAAASGNKDSY